MDRPKKSNRAGGVASFEKEASSNSASPTALATRVSAAKDLPIVNVKFAPIFIRKLAKAKCNGTATIVVDIIAVDENRIVARARKVTC